MRVDLGALERQDACAVATIAKRIEWDSSIRLIDLRIRDTT